MDLYEVRFDGVQVSLTDRRAAILDPSYKPGKFDIPERQGKVEVVADKICLCAPEVLAADIEALGDKGLYIFRR